MFFSSCGVIFALSGAPGMPRGPSFFRAMSSSVCLCSSGVPGFIYVSLPNAVVTSNMGASARKEKSRLRVSRHVRAAQGGRLKAARRYMPDVCGEGEPLGDTDRSGFAYPGNGRLVSPSTRAAAQSQVRGDRQHDIAAWFGANGGRSKDSDRREVPRRKCCASKRLAAHLQTSLQSPFGR
jgi:hypothetical protein